MWDSEVQQMSPTERNLWDKRKESKTTNTILDFAQTENKCHLRDMALL